MDYLIIIATIATIGNAAMSANPIKNKVFNVVCILGSYEINSFFLLNNKIKLTSKLNKTTPKGNIALAVDS